MSICLHTHKNTLVRLRSVRLYLDACMCMPKINCSIASATADHVRLSSFLSRIPSFTYPSFRGLREVPDTIFRQMLLRRCNGSTCYVLNVRIFNLNGLIFASGIMLFYSLSLSPSHTLYRNRIYSKSKFYRPNYRVIRSILSFICAARLKESNFLRLSPRNILYIFSISYTSRPYIENRFSIFESNIFTIFVVIRANNPRKVNRVNEKKERRKINRQQQSNENDELQNTSHRNLYLAFNRFVHIGPPFIMLKQALSSSFTSLALLYKHTHTLQPPLHPRVHRVNHITVYKV